MAQYLGCMAGCSTMVKAKVLRVRKRDKMAYVKMGHNYGWIPNTYGAKRKDVIMVCLTNVVKK